jgi:hypothetical protein
MGFMRAERLGESWADRRCNASAQEEQQFPYLLDRVPVESDPLPDESSASVCSSPTVVRPPP